MSIWREDPNLKGKFHPDFPDDLQVLVHEGGFRFTNTRPEVMWARLVAKMEVTLKTGDKYSFYKGILLNQPRQLKTIRQHQEIYLIGAAKYPHAIRVSSEYIDERPFWEILPCKLCGLPEAFDPISTLYKKSFPAIPEEMNQYLRSFTSFCPVCGPGSSLLIREIKKPDAPQNTQKPNVESPK